jgi:hypothetical protein
LNGFIAEIGTDSYPINLAVANFATKPTRVSKGKEVASIGSVKLSGVTEIGIALSRRERSEETVTFVVWTIGEGQRSAGISRKARWFSESIAIP